MTQFTVHHSRYLNPKWTNILMRLGQSIFLSHRQRVHLISSHLVTLFVLSPSIITRITLIQLTMVGSGLNNSPMEVRPRCLLARYPRHCEPLMFATFDVNWPCNPGIVSPDATDTVSVTVGTILVAETSRFKHHPAGRPLFAALLSTCADPICCLPH